MAQNEMVAPSVSGTVADLSSKTSRAGKPPDDFESASEFLSYIRKEYDADRQADEVNRREMIQDARFVAGEQWDSAVKQRRDLASKPTLTINRLPAYVAQLVGNRRMNDVGIKIIPDINGTRKIADIREGLVRNIQKVSRAQYAYDKAFEQCVIGGLGNFQVHLDYAYDDVFDQDIKIAAISNPIAVVWDRASVDPSGQDATHVFVTDRIPRREFKRRYPDAQAADWDVNDLARNFGWDTNDSVQLVSFWRMRSKKRTLAMLTDGSVEDVTDLEPELWYNNVAEGDDGPIMREVLRPYAQMHLCTSQDILTGPYDLPICRVPVFRVPGWELFIEGDRIRWGLVRFLRDPQRLHNYWRSTIAEKLVGSPKNKWLAADSAVEGREDQWRKSHLTDDPLLIYNAESGAPPTRAPALEVEGALIEQSGTSAQDMRDVSNLHEASFGIQSNEVSGKAINARQRVGEVGTVIYQDNLNIAIEECGKVINDLIPFVYDTPRIIKVLGPDLLTEKQVSINDPENNPESVDITTGKYAVTITTGPSYVTRRVESREEMMAMVNAMPQTMAVAADKIVEAQDWPGAEEIAARLRTQLPPGMINPEDMSEEEQAAAQGQQEAAQKQEQIQDAMLQLKMEEQQAKNALLTAQTQEAHAKAREALARAEQAEAQAEKLIADIKTDRLKIAIDAANDMEKAAQPAGNGANRSK